MEGIRRLCPDLPVYWGNLFWNPLLVDTVAEMAKDGVKRAVCFATSVFDSPSGNKRYADALELVRLSIGANAPTLEKLPLPFEHTLFIEAQADRLLETLAWYDSAAVCRLPSAVILFSAHSIPLTDATQSHYVEQLHTTCRAVIEKSGTTIPWELVYQSRSGPTEHWLGPDIKERIGKLATKGQVETVIVSPIGFFCENMETVYDLDIEANELCGKLGLGFLRAKAVGAMPKICRLIVELIGA
jgi:ferrochelatase